MKNYILEKIFQKVPYVKTFKFFRDKKEGFGAPLKEGMGIYKYSDTDFSIEQRPLQKYEQYLIEAAQQLLSRYEVFKQKEVLTHITTNLNAEELQDKYGERIRSRMREMFNLVSFSATSTDKRK